jgi:hypothetical protein
LNRCVSHGHVFTTCHRSFALTAASKTARHPAIPERRRTAGSSSAAALPTLVGVSLSQPCPGRRRALQRAVYRPRDAEYTVLHQVVAEHLEIFLEAVAAAGDRAGLPSPVVSSGRNLSGCLSTGIT